MKARYRSITGPLAELALEVFGNIPLLYFALVHRLRGDCDAASVTGRRAVELPVEETGAVVVTEIRGVYAVAVLELGPATAAKVGTVGTGLVGLARSFRVFSNVGIESLINGAPGSTFGCGL